MLPTIATGNVASAIGGAFEVANSCRFNSADSAYMHKTLGSTSNQRTFTLSAWVKRSGLGVANQIMSMDRSGPRTEIAFNSDDKIACNFNPSGSSWSEFYSVAVFRDVSAWYHVVVSVDTTQGTDTNRLKIYVNGSLISFTGSLPSQDFDTGWNVSGNVHAVGRYENGSSGYFNGYMAEVCWIDGTAYAASDFGEFDEDSPTIWKPKDVSGLTFGTHGFYLDFEDSANLGNDANGGTDLTEVNLAATDQMTDTPTLNYSVMNPLNVPTSNLPTFAEGNLKTTSPGSGGVTKFGGTSTIGMTQGKWYLEAKATVDGTYSRNVIGITGEASSCADLNRAFDLQTNSCFGYGSEGGDSISNNSTSSYGDTYTTGDIVGVAIDLDNLKLYFSKNGTWQDSGDPTSGATGTGAVSIATAVASTTDGIYFVMQGDNTGSSALSIFEFNFGSPIYTISSGNADGNGYGNFEYAVPSGYFALNSKNLAEFG